MLSRSFALHEYLSRRSTLSDVVDYYAEMSRGSKLFEKILGPGMHTKLSRLSQENFLIAEIASSNAKLVAEVGCGTGAFSMRLAELLPATTFRGIDPVNSHVEAAVRGNKSLTNVTFYRGTGEGLCCNMQRRADVIFGVESFCHLDSTSSMVQFFRQCEACLTQNGKVIVIDAFRTEWFSQVRPEQSTCLRLAESALRIKRLHTKQEWAEAARTCGLELKSYTDLTSQALPFWEVMQRLSRMALKIPGLGWFLKRNYPCHLDTLLAGCTIFHALKNRRAAEYGVMVLRRGA